MKFANYVFLLFFLLNGFLTQAQGLAAVEVEELLTDTWYSYQVGDPENGSMFDTENPEEIIFFNDGRMKLTILHKIMGKMEYMGNWAYNKSEEKLEFQIEMDGNTEKQLVVIRELEEGHMILEIPRKVTSYSTEVSEKFAIAQEESASDMAASEEGTSGGVDADAWTGSYAFNEATLYLSDETSESYPSKGQLELYVEDGKKFIKKTENGYTDIFEITQSMSIGGARHYGIVTDDEEIAGEFVLTEEGIFYYYKDKDQSTVEYLSK